MVGDAELAVAAASGDRTALADIYDRYADSLHEMCRAVLHDAHEASDAVHDTFVIASTRLGQLRDPDRLKPWLFAIARRESIRRSSKRARMRPSHDEVLDVPVVDDTYSGGEDAAALVWEAANALTERERALLVLNVRQGLEGADLADAAGMPGPQASVVLSRAKTQLASAVRCTLLLRNGRAECSELATIVPAAHRMLDGLTRKRVARHAQGCAICEPKWNASPDALGILAAAPLLGAPAALKRKTLDDIELISSSKPLGDGHWRADGFPPAENDGNRRKPVILSIAAALIALVVAAGLVLAGNDDTPTLSAIDGGDDATTTIAAPAGSETTLAAGASTTTPKRTTTTKKGTTATTAKPGAGAATTTPPTVPPTAPPTTAITITTSGPRGATMTTCAAGTFTATTSAPTGPLYVHYRNSNGGGSKNMSSTGGNAWSASVSIPSAGEYVWFVSTSPVGTGGTSSAPKQITVTPCPQ